jgi:hypothetical protein
MQKQEIITEFLAKGDPERAHMMIKSWYSTVEDEVAKYLPGGVRQNPDFKIDLTEDLASDPTIKALIAEKLSRALIQEEVDRALRAIEHSSEEGLANSWSLDDFLEREFEETGFIVDRLMKYGANVHLVAAAKTGKTNAIINLTKALADGGNFLGVFETKPIKGRICMMDFELVSSAGSRAIDPNVPINRYQGDIARLLLADFMMLGASSTGSFALSIYATPSA